jgi:hypothetical protein
MIDWIMIFLFRPEKENDTNYRIAQLSTEKMKENIFDHPKIAGDQRVQLRSSDFVIGKQETRHEVNEKKKFNFN